MNNKNVFEGNFEKLDSKKIYLNINHLDKGKYKLNIVHKNKIISTTQFKKE